jgi:hypothetical protein
MGGVLAPKTRRDMLTSIPASNKMARSLPVVQGSALPLVNSNPQVLSP